MNDLAAKRSVRSVHVGHDDAEGEADRPGSAIIISMVAAGISGFVVGLLCRGEFAFAGVVLLLALFCVFIGWWARGVMR